MTLITREPGPSRPIPHGWQGRFHSRKVGQTLRWRSQLVYELFCQWEVDPAVTSFAFRPYILSLTSSGKRRSYTPDAMKVTGDAPWLIEVCWESQVTDAKLLRWTLFGAALAGAGFGFQLLTERQTRHEPRLANSLSVVRTLPAEDPSPIVLAHVRGLLDGGPLPFAELMARAGLDVKGLLRLALIGEVTFDLDADLTAATPVARSGIPQW